MSIDRIRVELGERSYPIFIGSIFEAGSVTNMADVLPEIGSAEVLIVTNQTVSELFLDQVVSAVKKAGAPSKLNTLVLPEGEQYKNLDTLNLIFDELLTHRYSRKALLIALGGGVIGDMVGFAAATYQRGIDFIQIPTTLLSQVDSSVGGKTGVNHALGKNMIGAFHQPQVVLIDINSIDTLPDRELSAGLAEVIKYGLIADKDFFIWLEQNIQRLMSRDHESLTYAIKRSCEIKADVVAQDEREGGVRAILNLGHTYGHAIETHQGYGTWLHGEAVGAGMVMACELSRDLGWIDEDVVARAASLIQSAGLPIKPPADMNKQDFLSIMAVDKKVDRGQLRLVLLKELGHAVVTADFDSNALHQQLERLTY